MTMPETLAFIRHQLDWLAYERLETPLEPEEESTYQELCSLEQEALRSANVVL